MNDVTMKNEEEETEREKEERGGNREGEKEENIGENFPEWLNKNWNRKRWEIKKVVCIYMKNRLTKDKFKTGGKNKGQGECIKGLPLVDLERNTWEREEPTGGTNGLKSFSRLVSVVGQFGVRKKRKRQKILNVTHICADERWNRIISLVERKQSIKFIQQITIEQHLHPNTVTDPEIVVVKK